MLVNVPHQEPAVGIPQHAECFEHDFSDYAAAWHDLDHLRLHGTDLGGQGDMRVAVCCPAVLNGTCPSLANAAMGPRLSITLLCVFAVMYSTCLYFRPTASTSTISAFTLGESMGIVVVLPSATTRPNAARIQGWPS